MESKLREVAAAAPLYGRATIDPDPETPPDSPLTLADVVASPFYGDLSTPTLAEGDPAYPFALPTPDGQTVRLTDFRGERPVALIFGSYT